MDAGWPEEAEPFLAQLAVGPRRAYALLGRCLGRPDMLDCYYRLSVSTDEGRSWRRSGLSVPPSHGRAAAQSVRLLVAGPGEVLSVIDEEHGTGYVSTDGGGEFTTRRLAAGPAADEVPPGLVAEVSPCVGVRCPAPLVQFFEPATGRTRPLRTQPPVSVESLVVDGDAVWVAGITGGRPAAALSRDRGRTWRRLPAIGEPAGRAFAHVRIAPVPGGSAAYLIGAYPGRKLGAEQVGEVWWIGPPDRAAWRWLTLDPFGPATATTAIGLANGRLLVSGAIVVSPAGSVQLQPVPEDASDGVLPPEEAQRGAGTSVWATTRTADPTVMFSPTGQVQDWHPRRIPVG